MDTELEAQLNEQLQQMSDLLGQQNSAMSAQVKAMNDVVSSIKAQTSTTNNSISAENKTATSNNTASKKSEAATKAMGMIEEANKGFKTGIDKGATSAIGFANAMLEAAPGMAKYSESVKGATLALAAFSSGFGAIGKAAGVLLGGLSKLVSASFAYTDTVVKGYDDVAKLGGAIGSSAEEILQLGHNAGLTSQNLELFTKNAAALGPNIKILGTTTSDSVKSLGQIFAVGDKTLQQYRKVGITQDRLMELQTGYIDTQAKAGADLKKNPKEVQKESLKYIDSLNEMASVTGISADKQKELLDQALQQENYQARVAQITAQMNAAKEGPEKEKLKTILAGTEAAGKVAMMYGPKTGGKLLEAISATGEAVVTANTAGLMTFNPKLQQVIHDLTSGNLDAAHSTASFIDAMSDGTRRTNKMLGDNLIVFGSSSRNLQDMTAQSNEARTNFARFGDQSKDQLLKNGLVEVKSYEDQKNQTTGDMADRAKLESEERSARQAFDTVLAKTSASLNSMLLKMLPKVNTALTFLANHITAAGNMLKGLAIALGALAGIGVIAKVIGSVRSFFDNIGNIFGGKKELGSANKPMHVRLAEGSAAMGKMTGTSSGDAARSSRVNKLTKEAEAGANKSDKGMSGISKMAAQPGADKSGGFLEGLAKGLQALGKAAPEVIEGSGALAVAIAAIGAAVGTAGFILGKTLPFLAKGLHDFDKVDGDNLKGVGIGMAGLGAGILAMGGAPVVNAFGSLVSMFSKTDEKDDPIQKLGGKIVDFQKIPIHPDKLSKNAKAFVEFSNAFADAATNATLGTVASGVADSVVGFFGKATKPLFFDVLYFSSLDINEKRVKNNALAFKDFGEAMSSYNGNGPLGSLGSIGTALAEGVSSVFNVKPPIAQFVDFAKQQIDPKKAKSNAAAFVDFANAMSSYKAAPGALDALSQWVGSKILDPNGPIKDFAEFSKKDFGPNMEKNADAFSKYASSMAATGSTPAQNNGAGGSGGGGGPAQQNNSSGTAGSVGGVISSAATTVGTYVSNAWSSFVGNGAENGVRPEILAKKAQLEKIMGRKLTVTSGVRPGVANHGDGHAIDLGLNTNSLTDQERIKLITNAIGLGFTGIGAEYRAAGGAHIHLDNSHKSLTAWGSDTTSKSLSKDAPWLLQYINTLKTGRKPGTEHGGPTTPPNSQLVSSINTKSVISKLAKTPATKTTVDKAKKATSMVTQTHGASQAIYAYNMELNKEIVEKLDKVINVLENDHDTQHKILREVRM